MNSLTIAQTAIAVLLIVSILLQRKGSGLGSTFGGDSMSYSTRRGAEKVIFYASIVLTILFAGIAIARLVMY